MDRQLQLLESLIASRNNFLRRPYMYANRREAITEQFFDNERRYLEVIRESIISGQAPVPITLSFPMTIPNSFLETTVPVLPTNAQVNSEIQEFNGSESPQACAICQEQITMDGCRLRSCNHAYHSACVRMWFGASARCPVCRRDIREDPVTQTTSASPETPSQQQSQ